MKETPVSVLNPEGKAPLLLVSDHASNHIPDDYGDLGLNRDQLNSHVAYDIGAKGLVTRLSVLLDAPAIVANFSRLLIDPNRAPGQLGLIVEESDGLVIPDNKFLDQRERDQRIDRFYKPFHRAISNLIDSRIDAGQSLALVSLHSFTPVLQNQKPRPWHLGFMWNKDDRLAQSIMNNLSEDQALIIGENEPYSGEFLFYTMRHHGEE